MYILKKGPRKLGLNEPIRHESHKRPTTRRDFIAHGFMTGPAVVAAPSLLTMLLGPQQAAALSPDGGSSTPTLPGRLTTREVEVLRLLASGASNQAMAEHLVLSVKTVERHIANIYAKIGARGRVDAVTFAHRHGLLEGNVHPST